jgi:DNA-binding response OmpR family regulator
MEIQKVSAMGKFKQRLLLVEDDQQLSVALINYYRNQGFVVDHVNSGKKAIDYIIRHNPQMVIRKDQLSDLNSDEIHRLVRPYFTGKLILSKSNLNESIFNIKCYRSQKTFAGI